MQNDRFLTIAYQARTAEETRDLYDRWAQTCDTELIDENGYARPRRCTEMLSRHLTDRRAEILDIGCGTGLAGAALLREGYGTVDGCDFSPGMLAKARETGLYRRLFEADLNAPPLDAADEAYGAAVAVGVFSFSLIRPNTLGTSGRIDLLAEEHGDHIRGTGATGWTVALRKAADVR